MAAQYRFFLAQVTPPFKPNIAEANPGDLALSCIGMTDELCAHGQLASLDPCNELIVSKLKSESPHRSARKLTRRQT